MHFSKPVEVYNTKGKLSIMQILKDRLGGWGLQGRTQAITKEFYLYYYNCVGKVTEEERE